MCLRSGAAYKWKNFAGSPKSETTARIARNVKNGVPIERERDYGQRKHFESKRSARKPAAPFAIATHLTVFAGENGPPPQATPLMNMGSGMTPSCDKLASVSSGGER